MLSLSISFSLSFHLSLAQPSPSLSLALITQKRRYPIVAPPPAPSLPGFLPIFFWVAYPMSVCECSSPKQQKKRKEDTLIDRSLLTNFFPLIFRRRSPFQAKRNWSVCRPLKQTDLLLVFLNNIRYVSHSFASPPPRLITSHTFFVSLFDIMKCYFIY